MKKDPARAGAVSVHSRKIERDRAHSRYELLRPALLLGLVLAFGAAADTPSQPMPVKLVSGLNEIDLDGDGPSDVIVKAWRENFNAHGFYNYAFYRRTPKGEWEVIPIEHERDGVPRIGFDSHRGADCILSDLRIYKTKTGGVRLVIGEREMGNSYADSRVVTFSWYALERNEDGYPGRPRHYFAKTRTETTQNQYCDVNEAFVRELSPD